MRYYKIQFPNGDVSLTSNVRRLRNIPEGTRIFAIITARDGSLMDEYELPVEGGRVRFPRRRDVESGSSSIHVRGV